MEGVGSGFFQNRWTAICPNRAMVQRHINSSRVQLQAEREYYDSRAGYSRGNSLSTSRSTEARGFSRIWPQTLPSRNSFAITNKLFSKCVDSLISNESRKSGWEIVVKINRICWFISGKVYFARRYGDVTGITIQPSDAPPVKRGIEYGPEFDELSSEGLFILLAKGGKVIFVQGELVQNLEKIPIQFAKVMDAFNDVCLGDCKAGFLRMYHVT